MSCLALKITTVILPHPATLFYTRVARVEEVLLFDFAKLYQLLIDKVLRGPPN